MYLDCVRKQRFTLLPLYSNSALITLSLRRQVKTNIGSRNIAETVQAKEKKKTKV